MQRGGRPAHHLHASADDVLHRAAVGFRAHRINTDVRAQPVGRLFQEQHRVSDGLEVVGLAGGIVSHEVQAVIQLINHDDPPCPEEPGASGRHDAHRAGPEHHHRVAGLNAAHLGGLIAGRHDVGQHHRIVRVHAFRNDRRPDIGIGNADIFRLSSVVAARRMRIAENAADRRGLGVGFMAVPIQFLLAEDALAAGDIERHQDVIADLQFLHLRADLLHHAGDLVAERHPHPGIRHGPIVQMQIGPADTGARDPDDGILRMQDLRHGFMIDADPLRPAEIHCKHKNWLLL